MSGRLQHLRTSTPNSLRKRSAIRASHSGGRGFGARLAASADFSLSMFGSFVSGNIVRRRSGVTSQPSSFVQ